MGRISEQVIQEILGRTDLLDVVKVHLDVKHVGRRHFALCPFHQERTPSFSINPEKGYYHCFGCGAHGSAIDFLVKVTGGDFRSSVNELAQRAGITLPQDNMSVIPAADPHEELYACLDQARSWYQQNLTAPLVQSFLSYRGILPETAEAFCLGYASFDPRGLSVNLSDYSPSVKKESGLFSSSATQGLKDRFRHRLMFPIISPQMKTLGFGGRVLHPKSQPKYLNSPASPIFHKGKILYGWPQAQVFAKREASVCVVEGYMDVLALSQRGYRAVVGVLGTACTEQHVQYLFQHVAKIIFCFDSDEAGYNAAYRALSVCWPYLSDEKQAVFVILPLEYKDPDDYIKIEGIHGFEKLTQRAVSAVDFWESVWQKRWGDSNQPGEQKHFWYQVSREWAKIRSLSIQEQIIDSLSRRLQLTRQYVRDILLQPTVFNKEPSQKGVPLLRSPSRFIAVRRFVHSVEQKLALLLSMRKNEVKHVPRHLIRLETKEGLLLLEVLKSLEANCEDELLQHPWRAILLPDKETLFHSLSQEEWEAEFQGALLCLERQFLKCRCEYLSQQSQKTPLTKQEQEELLQGLRELQKMRTVSPVSLGLETEV